MKRKPQTLAVLLRRPAHLREAQRRAHGVWWRRTACLTEGAKSGGVATVALPEINLLAWRVALAAHTHDLRAMAAMGVTVGMPRVATPTIRQARPAPSRGAARLVCRAAAAAPAGSATRLTDAFKATLDRNQCVHS